LLYDEAAKAVSYKQKVRRWTGSTRDAIGESSSKILERSAWPDQAAVESVRIVACGIDVTGRELVHKPAKPEALFRVTPRLIATTQKAMYEDDVEDRRRRGTGRVLLRTNVGASDSTVALPSVPALSLERIEP